MSSSPPPTSETIPDRDPLGQSWSMEQEADRLMDELFGDIDRLFGPTATPAPPSRSSAPFSTRPPVPPMEPVEEDPEAMFPLATPGGALAVPEAIFVPEVPESPPLPPSPVDMSPGDRPTGGPALWLLSLSCLSLVGVLGLWVQQGWLSLPTVGVPIPPVTHPAPPSKDGQFTAYVQRVLELLDRQNPKKASPASKAEDPRPAIPVPPPGNVPVTLPTPVEKVLIPPAPSAVKPPTPLPSPNPVTVKTIPIPPAPTASPSLPAPRPVADVPPAPMAPKKETPAVALPPAPQPLPAPPAAPLTHTLMGILEAGDNSVALFSINGSTQRIRLGEAIGDSGWLLVSVNDKQAVMRRNGDVRAIYVGQKF